MTTPHDTSTPCIGICSTIYGDEVCRGCKRTYQEIIDWNGYMDDQKWAILTRLDTHIHSIMKEVIEITDQSLLQERLEKHKIPARHGHSPLTWAFLLLQEGGSKIGDLSLYGLKALPPHDKKSPKVLYEWCDERIYELAVDAYEQQA
jgi:uncharacterized protein